MNDWLAKLDTSNQLVWYGQGSGGGWHVHIRKSGDGFEVSETLENDSDPMGGANPVTTTQQLDAAAAGSYIATQIAQHGQPGVAKR